MQTYHVNLQSEVFKTFRCQRAANSLDIDTGKKSVHELRVSADLEAPFQIGLIVGASGSGKTTLAKKIFGDDCFKSELDVDKPIIEQFPAAMTYDECAAALSGIGLTSVPCWIRPVKTLSNGQKARAEAALLMVGQKEITVIDEWTSVVDRTVAKAMSHCVQKFARKFNKKIILLSCHYDVLEWINPDWVIDCNKQEFIDRRLLQPEERGKREPLQFDIRQVDRKSWKYFSKYHYLSDTLPGGKIFTYGLFHGANQIGFQCFANYVPKRPGNKIIFHSNRTVVHPDYAGLGLGIKLINACTKHMLQRLDCRVLAKFSAVPLYRARLKDPSWRLLKDIRQVGRWSSPGRPDNPHFRRDSGFRENVRVWTFEYVGEK